MVQHTTGTCLGTRGIQLYTQRWIPDNARGVLLIVHGVGDHSARYTQITQTLPEYGFVVASYDQRGHGRSAGIRGHVTRWQDYCHDLQRIVQSIGRDHFPLPLFLLGHSMGSLVVLRYLLSRPGDVRGAIISAPPMKAQGVAKPGLILLARILSCVCPRWRLTLSIQADALSRDAGMIDAYRTDPLVHRQVTVRWGTEALAARATIHQRAAEIRVPLLLVHGEADNIAAVRGSVELFERVGSHDKQLLTYPAALHELHNDTNREQVIEDYRLWLQRQCLACSNRT